MLKYTGELYAKFGRRFIPTGKTGADWDAMEARLKSNGIKDRPPIDAVVEFDWDGEKRLGVVTTYQQCAEGCFEVLCERKFDNEVMVLRSDMVRILPNDKSEPRP